MKALTLYQPYATLIACLCKTIETRSWGTAYRGMLAIHAAKRCDDEIAEDCRRAMRILEDHSWPIYPAGEVTWGDTLGRVVAVATLVECQRISKFRDLSVRDLDYAFGNFSTGRWAWKLTDVRPIVPGISWRGSRGLWDVPEELGARIREGIQGDSNWGIICHAGGH